MGFIDSLKRFCGLATNNDKEENSRTFERRRDYTNYSTYEERLPVEEEERMGINIYSDPLEIAKFFEQQMDSMMKNMRIFSGLGHLDEFFSDTFIDTPETPGITIKELPPDDDNSGPSSPDNLRDQFLKPGFKKQRFLEKKTDDDLDGRINVDDVGKILQAPESNIAPYSRERPRFHFYGQSVTSKTVRLPNGTIETHRTVRDQEGNEETVVTHKFGDKEYTVTTRVDKQGNKIIEENMINMDESEKQIFSNPSTLQDSGTFNSFPKDWFDYERFFR